MISISFVPQSSLNKTFNDRDVTDRKEDILMHFFQPPIEYQNSDAAGGRQKGCNMCRKTKLFSEQNETLKC